MTKKLLSDLIFELQPRKVVYGLVTLKRIGREISPAAIEKEVQLHVYEVHSLFGHSGREDRISGSALALGFKLKRGNIRRYRSFAIGKAKQNSVPRYNDLSNETKLTRPCKRIILDMCLLKNSQNKDPNDKTPFMLRSQIQLIYDFL